MVAGDEAGERLDRVLAARTALTRSRLKALILDGAVAIGPRTIRDPGYRVNAGDTVAVEVPSPEPATPAPEHIPLNVVYEDDELIVIDKPAGLVVHPAASLIACRLTTGRTHQIRVHLAHAGHPLMGDATYATGFRSKAGQLAPAARDALAALGRQALHAYLLAIEHPRLGKKLEFRSELPAELTRLHLALRDR